MESADSDSQFSPLGRAHAVPRPVIGSRQCPVCRKQELQGQQTVCSAACRRERSRQREAEARRARDQEIRTLLEEALRRLGEAVP
jgi:hypothetical protein